MSLKLLQYFIVLCITLIFLEISCWVVSKPLSGEKFSYHGIEQKRLKRIKTIQEKINHVTNKSPLLYDFHPYLGYSGNPKVAPWGKDNPTFNQYGMLSIARHAYPYKKHSNEFVIAVLGGSVAEIFANFGEKPLNRYLKNNSNINRKVVLISLATGGYKQPQQIFHLLYAMLSGFEFDAVINIDGFNEIVSIPRNVDHNINPLFPSSHEMSIMSKSYMRNSLDVFSIKNLYKYYSLHYRELFLLTLINKRPFKYSVFLNIVGELWTSYTTTKINQLKHKLYTDAQKSLSREFRGPEFEHSSNKYELAAEIWQHCSKVLHDICKANGLLYIHFLQPNQYVPNSKPLSENEKKKAFVLNSELAISVQTGYPYLFNVSSKLINQGIPFYDLTLIFQNTTNDIYSDSCCHFGLKGNEIMAEHVAQKIIIEIGKQQQDQ